MSHSRVDVLRESQWPLLRSSCHLSFGTDGRSLGSRSAPQPEIPSRGWSLDSALLRYVLERDAAGAVGDDAARLQAAIADVLEQPSHCRLAGTDSSSA